MKQLSAIIRNNIVSFLLLTAGAVIAAFSLEEFLVPNNIFDGGITGVSMIIGNSSKIPLAALIAAINIPFLFVALKKLGKKFLLLRKWPFPIACGRAISKKVCVWKP